MPLSAAQVFFKLGDAVSYLEVFIADADRSAQESRLVDAALGGHARIFDWQRANSGIVNAVEIERNVMFLILTLIILVAAFNIISGMIMMVKDKGRDIAILRTMGASRGMILRIFMLSGASIGVLGTAVPAGRAARQFVLGGNLFLHPYPGACRPGRGRCRRADGARAVLPGDPLPVVARGAARSGRGAALRMTFFSMVIPGRPEGPSPEPMNTCGPEIRALRCSRVPGPPFQGIPG
jgi:hypothetical protein